MAEKKKNGKRRDNTGGHWKDWLDTGSKYLGAVAGLLAIYVAHNFQATLTTTNLINQREEAESSLRATMFSNLIKPLIVTDSNKDLTVENEKLLSELLSLNFHENFEFKPLLVHLDERLKNSKSPDRDAQRNELRSIARRVIQRQEALVTRLERNSRSDTKTAAVNGCVTRIVILRAGQKESSMEAGAGPTDNKFSCSDLAIVREEHLYQGNKNNELIKIQSPDGKIFLDLVVDGIDWQNQYIKVNLTIRSEGMKPPESQATNAVPLKIDKDDSRSYRASLYEALYALRNQQGTISGPLADTVKAKNFELEKNFKLTWFDFPLTDYTLLRNGTRFSFYIEDFHAGEFAVIKLLWFPRDFFSPRERPTSYRAYREKPWE